LVREEGISVDFPGSSPTNYLTIPTEEEEREQVLSILNDAIAAAQSGVGSELPATDENTLINGKISVSSLPEPLQNAARELVTENVRFVSSLRLFPFCWPRVALVLIPYAVLVAILLVISWVDDSPSVGTQVGSPIAPNTSADGAKLRMIIFAIIGAIALFGILYLSLGMVSVIITSTSFMHYQFPFGVQLLTHRKVIQSSTLVLPNQQGLWSTAEGHLLIDGKIVPVSAALSSYNWMISRCSEPSAVI
jgi:hypothetical protein